MHKLRLLCLLALGSIAVLLHVGCEDIDEFGPPTLEGVEAQDQCSTFATSGVFEFVCQLEAVLHDRELEKDLCSEHCQCAHNASWGECVVRPKYIPEVYEYPVGTFLAEEFKEFGNKMCICYYDTTTHVPPEGWTPKNESSFWCRVFQNLVVPILLCEGLERCEGDCICGHGFQEGHCTNTTATEKAQCVCSNPYPYSLSPSSTTLLPTTTSTTTPTTSASVPTGSTLPTGLPFFFK